MISVDVVVVQPALVASVVGRVDVHALHQTLILGQQVFQYFEVVAVDNLVAAAGWLGGLGAFGQGAVLVVEEAKRNVLVVVDYFVFTNPVEGGMRG